jgi:hypothetical protein
MASAAGARFTGKHAASHFDSLLRQRCRERFSRGFANIASAIQLANHRRWLDAGIDDGLRDQVSFQQNTTREVQRIEVPLRNFRRFDVG